jgi:preprotein translocase subunit SecF
MIDWMKYRWLYFSISGIAIAVGVFSWLYWGPKYGVDFTGGTVIEYQFDGDISTEDFSKVLGEKGVNVTSIQGTQSNSYIVKLPPISTEQKSVISDTLKEKYDDRAVELRYENVGPTIGPELVKKTIYAITISAGVILLWVAYQFKSLKFGASAVLAMFHDSIILLGSIALLGHFYDAEVDFLYVTALLTTLSFSVHDTIVVYDRIRESQKSHPAAIYDTANRAITETMVRSLNNSFTIVFMLLALLLLGGTTIKWFAATLLIGTVSGTYSSPFVAVPLLITWEEISDLLKTKKLNFRRSRR